MELWKDVITPADLTDYARRSMNELNDAEGSLAQHLPAENTVGDTGRFVRTETGLQPVAAYRGLDTESSIGSMPGTEQVRIALPPISQKIRVAEADLVAGRMTTTDEQQVSVAKATDLVVRAIYDRLELARGQVIESGRVKIDENGFKTDFDLGRDKELTITAAVPWSEDNADPLNDLLMWVKKYQEKNLRAEPGVLVTSREVLSTLQRNLSIRKAVDNRETTSIVSVTELNALLAAFRLPTVTTFEKVVNVGGKITPVLSPNKVFFLPTPGSNQLGNTIFGTTAEMGDPSYGLAGLGGGIMAAALKSYDPLHYWAHANCMALPILKNANGVLVANVLGGKTAEGHA